MVYIAWGRYHGVHSLGGYLWVYDRAQLHIAIAEYNGFRSESLCVSRVVAKPDSESVPDRSAAWTDYSLNVDPVL